MIRERKHLHSIRCPALPLSENMKKRGAKLGQCDCKVENTYRRVITGEGEEIFVRQDEWAKFEQAFKAHDPKKIVRQTLALLLSSPEGMQKLYDSTHLVHMIMKVKNIRQLENLKDVIDHKIKAIKYKGKIDNEKETISGTKPTKQDSKDSDKGPVQETSEDVSKG